MASDAEGANRASITDAREMFTFAKDNLSRDGSEEPDKCPHFKRTVVFIASRDTERDRHRRHNSHSLSVFRRQPLGGPT